MHASFVESVVRRRVFVAAFALLSIAACSSSGHGTVKADGTTTLPSAVQTAFTTWAHDRTDARGELTVDFVQTTVEGPAEYASAFGVGDTPVYYLFAKGSYHEVGPLSCPRVNPSPPTLSSTDSTGSATPYTANEEPAVIGDCTHPPGNLMGAVSPDGSGCTCWVSDYTPDLSRYGTALTTVVNISS